MDLGRRNLAHVVAVDRLETPATRVADGAARRAPSSPRSASDLARDVARLTCGDRPVGHTGRARVRAHSAVPLVARIPVDCLRARSAGDSTRAWADGSGTGDRIPLRATALALLREIR